MEVEGLQWEFEMKMEGKSLTRGNALDGYEWRDQIFLEMMPYYNQVRLGAGIYLVLSAIAFILEQEIENKLEKPAQALSSSAPYSNLFYGL